MPHASQVEDGTDHSLRCVGQALEATLSFGAKRLDLGVLAVGLPADRSIPIVNGGKNVAVYHAWGPRDEWGKRMLYDIYI